MKGLKSIGKGAFSKVYLNPCGETVTIVSKDYVKECMSLGWLSDSEIFPSVERVDSLDDGSSVYTMKYYPKVRSLKNNLLPAEYENYKLLVKVFNTIPYTKNIHDSYDVLYNHFNNTIDNEELKNTLLDALDGLTNYGTDIGFEISPRNVAVNDGKLILLDVFFMRSQLQAVRNKTL